jgi:hypothetical protein
MSVLQVLVIVHQLLNIMKNWMSGSAEVALNRAHPLRVHRFWQTDSDYISPVAAYSRIRSEPIPWFHYTTYFLTYFVPIGSHSKG